MKECKHKSTYIQPFAQSKKIYVFCTSCHKCIKTVNISDSKEELKEDIKYGGYGWIFGNPSFNKKKKKRAVGC